MNTERRKKVLFFLPSTTGGAERMTITIAKMLPSDYFHRKVIIMDKTEGTIGQFVPSNITCEYHHVVNAWDFLTLRIYRILKQERPDVVFCSMMYLSARVVVAAKMAGNICTIIRNNNYWKTLRKDQFLLCKYTFKLADIIIAQQEEMREEVIRVLHCVPQKVITLHNPLDTESIDAKKDVPSPYTMDTDIIKYVWVARFHRNKGQDILARAFTLVARESPKAHLFYIGDYNTDRKLYNEVKTILDNGGCSDRVHFVGFDNNPYRWIQNADCFVLPSRIEGLPNVLIEAQYLGCPSVAAMCIPIISRIIENGINGFIVPCEDHEAMATAMLKAIKLDKVEMTYQPSTKEDYIMLFE